MYELKLWTVHAIMRIKFYLPDYLPRLGRYLNNWIVSIAMQNQQLVPIRILRVWIAQLVLCKFALHAKYNFIFISSNIVMQSKLWKTVKYQEAILCNWVHFTVRNPWSILSKIAVSIN